jgi:DNA-directed RNA polymerase specialized sigma24 family protein
MTETETKTTGPPGVEQLYRQHRTTLLRLAFLLTGSREHGEDVVQSAFASVVDRWDQIEQPLPYLRRIIVNQAANVHRRTGRERQRMLMDGVTHIPEVDETWVHIQQLPAPQRTVVVLRFYEDLPLVQIAELMNRPATTVRSDLRRALDRLRRLIPR